MFESFIHSLTPPNPPPLSLDHFNSTGLRANFNRFRSRPGQAKVVVLRLSNQLEFVFPLSASCRLHTANYSS